MIEFSTIEQKKYFKNLKMYFYRFFKIGYTDYLNCQDFNKNIYCCFCENVFNIFDPLEIQIYQTFRFITNMKFN